MDKDLDAGIRVLLVDDNRFFKKIALDFLRRSHEMVVVGAASGGEEALIKTLSHRPNVVLIDLGLPGLSGIETIPRLRMLRPGLKIVCLTLESSPAFAKASQRVGADDLVIKSKLTTDLLPTIRRVVIADSQATT